MTSPALTRCIWTDPETGARCDQPGTVDPARWNGCRCAFHAEVAMFQGRCLVRGLRDLDRQAREQAKEEAA